MPDQDSHATVHVVNRTAQPFTLEEGTEIGQASLATIQDNIVDLNNLPEQVLNNSVPPARVEQTVKLDDNNSSIAHISQPVTTQSHDYVHLQPVIDNLPTELTPREREEAVQFIQQYSDVFSSVEFDLG